MAHWKRCEWDMNESKKPEEGLFNAARQLTDPRQRAAFLDAACDGDAELRHRLDELFAARPEAELFFEQPRPGPKMSPAVAGSPSANAPGSPERIPSLSAAAVPAETLVVSTDMVGANEQPGERIGRYKLLQRIGEGGCGVVESMGSDLSI